MFGLVLVLGGGSCVDVDSCGDSEREALMASGMDAVGLLLMLGDYGWYRFFNGRSLSSGYRFWCKWRPLLYNSSLGFRDIGKVWDLRSIATSIDDSGAVINVGEAGLSRETL